MPTCNFDNALAAPTQKSPDTEHSTSEAATTETDDFSDVLSLEMKEMLPEVDLDHVISEMQKLVDKIRQANTDPDLIKRKQRMLTALRIERRKQLEADQQSEERTVVIPSIVHSPAPSSPNLGAQAQRQPVPRIVTPTQATRSTHLQPPQPSRSPMGQPRRTGPPHLWHTVGGQNGEKEPDSNFHAPVGLSAQDSRHQTPNLQSPRFTPRTPWEEPQRQRTQHQEAERQETERREPFVAPHLRGFNRTGGSNSNYNM
ncbi:hypothetical protein M426DRAFT_168412 [Hypoxylon sp. CI-4A]|nr:hypothetical protein M426DRAFT_168412 [Hypoxylon sp. CI-4A]